MREPRRWSVVRVPLPVGEWIESTSRRIGVPPYRVLHVLMDGMVEGLPVRTRQQYATLLKNRRRGTLQ
jgi:hypothetical protein